MDGTIDGLIRFSAKQVTGQQRRTFSALVCKQLCDGNVLKAEERFGWGREAVARGLKEESGQTIEKHTVHHSPLRSEVRNPQLAVDIRLIVEPHTHTDPELKTARLYSNLSQVKCERRSLKRARLKRLAAGKRVGVEYQIF